MSSKKEYASFYRKHLLEGIVPFWDERCIDSEFGGYNINFDREGNPTDPDKYIWFQGRQTFFYAFLYNEIEQREVWLRNAKQGFDFLVNKAYAGGGRFNYHMSREGEVKTGTTSIHSDCFSLQGVSEYIRASGERTEENMRFLNECFDVLEKNVMDPYFKDIYENTWNEKYIWHDLYLTALSATDVISNTLGAERTKKLIDYCLDKIIRCFVKDEHKLIFEAVGWDGQVCFDEPHGSVINPGHGLESMWFCLNVARKRGDKTIIEKALEAIKWMAEIGFDKEHGGVFSYLDAHGKEPLAIDWFKETDSLWDDKVWWANCESLCSMAMAYSISGDEYYMKRFEELHEFCQKYFYDPEYGEWYEGLHRDGTVKKPDKGTMWKCAYHLGRAVIYIIKFFDE